MFKFRLSLLLGILLASTVWSFAQKDLTKPIPLNPQIKTGKLSNGLTYYLLENKKPEKRVELRLVVNAGSILEDDNQLGLAHFVEHMAFNGTANFKKNELVSYLQSVGVKFGAHLNAYTSFDETVYMLKIPTEDKEIVEKGFQILEDWAHQVSFENEEIDKERGVVMEEWRLGRGADQRMLDEYLPVLYKNSRYAERLPIGTKEVLEGFSYETIKKFYKDWYRPDLMAVVVVGDMPIAEMEKYVTSHFNKLEARKNPRERSVYNVPDHKETFISINSDKEAAFSSVSLMYKYDPKPIKTLQDYRQQMVEYLYTGMLSERLEEISKKPDTPFSFAYSYAGSSWARTKNAFNLGAQGSPENIEKMLQTLLEEAERVKKYGFTQAELELVKAQVLKQLEDDAKEVGKTESSWLTYPINSYFLEGNPYPGAEFSYNFAKEHFASITLQEINALSDKWMTESNRAVLVTATEKEGVKLPTEKRVREMLKNVKKAKLAPYKNVEIAKSLMTQKPKAGTITSEKYFDKVDVTELTLSNGAKVVLKPTQFKNNEIMLRAISEGGYWLYDAKDDLNGSLAGSAIVEGGLGSMDNVALQKFMSDKNASVRPFVSSTSEGMNGKAAPDDLETALQMMYLYFTQPRKDEKGFQSYVNKQKAFWGNLINDPSFYFMMESEKFMAQNHPRFLFIPTNEMYDKANYERAFEIFKERFSNAGDFTFYFVGNFEVEKIKPLIATYIASLPSTKEKEVANRIDMPSPKGFVEKEFNKGIDPKSQVKIMFKDRVPYDEKEDNYLRAVAELLSIKLIENLREEKSGVYGVGAYSSWGKVTNDKYKNLEGYTLTISFPCGPENVKMLTEAAFEEVEKIQKNGVSDEDLKKVKEQRLKQMETDMQENYKWMNWISKAYQEQEDLSTILDYQKGIDALNSKDLQRVATKYLQKENCIKLVLNPEEKGK